MPGKIIKSVSIVASTLYPVLYIAASEVKSIGGCIGTIETVDL